jgi:uncharacterized protein YjbI with pentapeptide repeats
MAAKNRNDEAPQRSPADLPASSDELILITTESAFANEPIEESLVAGVDFSGRKLSGFSAKCSVFDGVSFAGCEMPSPRLRDVRFVKCDLSNATLRGFEATRVEFTDCRLTGMVAIECRWRDVLVENCDGLYAQITDGKLHTCEFRNSNFAEADFRNTDLEGTIFTQAVLTRADFSRSMLRGADFRGADIDGIIVGPEEVRGAIVSPTQAMDLARLLGLIIK